jgi:hypothetical protein
LRCLSQLLYREILLACPSVNDREIYDQISAIDGVFRNGHKFNWAPSFSDGVVFAAKTGIDQTEDGEPLGVIALRAAVNAIEANDHKIELPLEMALAKRPIESPVMGSSKAKVK